MSFIPGHLNLDDIVFTLRMTSYQFVEEQQSDRLYIRVIPSELAPGHIIDHNPCHWLRLRAFSLALIRSICWRGQELQLTTRWWYSRSPLADGVIPYGHLTQIFMSNRAASQSVNVNNKPAWNHFNMLVVVSLYVNVIGHYYS